MRAESISDQPELPESLLLLNAGGQSTSTYSIVPCDEALLEHLVVGCPGLAPPVCCCCSWQNKEREERVLHRAQASHSRIAQQSNPCREDSDVFLSYSSMSRQRSKHHSSKVLKLKTWRNRHATPVSCGSYV